MPFEMDIDYRQFSVKIAEADVANLKRILLGIPRSVIREKQLVMRQVWKHYVYNRPVSEPGDAFDMILRKLEEKHHKE